MPKCEEVQAELSAYLDGELTAQEKQALDAHLCLCNECNRVLAELELVRSSLSALPKVKAPPKLAHKVQTEINREASAPQEQPPLPRATPLLPRVVLALAAVVLVGLLLTLAMQSLNAPAAPVLQTAGAREKKQPQAGPLPAFAESAPAAAHAPARETLEVATNAAPRFGFEGKAVVAAPLRDQEAATPNTPPPSAAKPSALPPSARTDELGAAKFDSKGAGALALSAKQEAETSPAGDGSTGALRRRQVQAPADLAAAPSQKKENLPRGGQEAGRPIVVVYRTRDAQRLLPQLQACVAAKGGTWVALEPEQSAGKETVLLNQDKNAVANARSTPGATPAPRAPRKPAVYLVEVPVETRRELLNALYALQSSQSDLPTPPQALALAEKDAETGESARLDKAKARPAPAAQAEESQHTEKTQIRVEVLAE